MEFAGFKRRICSLLIDIVVYICIGILIAIVIDNPTTNRVFHDFFGNILNGNITFEVIIDFLSDLSTGPGALYFFLMLLFYIIYFSVLPIFTGGRTLGKYIFRIRIVKLNETRVTFGTMFLREILSKAVLGFTTFGIVYVFSIYYSLTSKGYRTIHDRMANTLVVKEKYFVKFKK